MRIDRSKLKKSSSDVPADCKTLIDRLTSSASSNDNKGGFLRELQRVQVHVYEISRILQCEPARKHHVFLLQCWTFGKCELFHWIDVLDLCDEVLEAAASKVSESDNNRDER